MKCEIKVSGSTGNYRSLGEMRILENGIEIDYNLFGDECLLRYDSGSLTHRRRGQVNLEMHFKEGELTLCSLGDGQNIGQFQVFSETVSVKSHKNGARVKLKYTSDGEQVELDFVAIRRN